ncbi:hypothetical protein pb186bvf_002899 [Paramecium bursaria]
MQQREEQLIGMDFTHIDNLDPCLEGGYHILYNQELPFLVRFVDDQEHQDDKNTVEVIRVRIMILGSPKDITQITLELSSENDLFFYYFHTVDRENFQNVKNQQQLSVEFQNYPDVCIKTFKRCQNEQQQFAPVLTLMSNSRGKVQILQTLEYKELELISFDMIAGDDEIIRQHVTFKYGSIKSKHQIINGKIKDVFELVKMKNPQLLLHLQKFVNY